VTGLTRFADDIMLPRMLHCKLLRSSLPHAIIEAIDVSRAQAHPGVHLVLTGKDFPVTFGILPVTQDEYPLAPERVRYVGDPVAAVVARDEQMRSRRSISSTSSTSRSRPSPILRRLSQQPSRASRATASRGTSTASRPSSSAT